MAITVSGKAHLLEIADAIENEPSRFEMSDFFDVVDLEDWTCSTTMCIAGWSAHLSNDIKNFGHDDLAARTGQSQQETISLCLESGVDVAADMPKHLRAKGMADALRQIAEGTDVKTALADVAERYI